MIYYKALHLRGVLDTVRLGGPGKDQRQFKGNHLSNATGLTQVFFKRGEYFGANCGDP